MVTILINFSGNRQPGQTLPVAPTGANERNIPFVTFNICVTSLLQIRDFLDKLKEQLPLKPRDGSP
jgi:hypothetical protein